MVARDGSQPGGQLLPSNLHVAGRTLLDELLEQRIAVPG